MAAYSVNLGKFYTVCKLGTGFTQKMLQELNTSNVPFDEEPPENRAITDNHAREIYKVAASIKPDVWFKPT